MKHTLLTLLLCLTALAAGAQTRSASQAASLARQFFSTSPATRSRTMELKLVWDGEDPATRTAGNTPAFYVFNRGESEGFVIISAREDTAPILGYARKGQFAVEGMPDNVSAWMHALRDHVRHEKPTRSQTAADLAMTGEVDLETPDWNQDYPYNDKCPELTTGWKAYTGCAMTAAGIVMGYHRWPDHGEGVIPSYKSTVGRLGPIELGAPYDWDSMDDIATLLFQLGVMARAVYRYDGTSAHLETFCDVLPRYMKYNPKQHFLHRNDYPDQEWKNMLRNEIDAGRPLPYEGFDETTGHAIVVDGYNDQGLFNINWGWGGYCNGFYDLDHMTPDGSGIGGNGTGGYSLGQGGIFEMRPRLASEAVTDRVEFISSQSWANGIEVRDLNLPLQKGDSFQADAGIIKNFGTNVIENDFILAITDDQGQVIEQLARTPAYPLNPFETQLAMDRPKQVTVTKDVRPGYRLRIVFRSALTDEWIPVTCNESVGKWEIVLNNSEPEPEPPLEASCTLEYDKTAGAVRVLVPEGAAVRIREKESGTDRSSVLVREGTAVTFQTRQLEKGSYILSIQSGEELKEVELRF